MTSIHPVRDVPSTSRSLPPVAALDRGRQKTRINTDPDAYASVRTPSGAVSVSLPPIRPGRGSKDEGCGPLPGISSIIDQSEYERPARRMSDTRAYPPPRDWDRVHSPSVWTPRQTRMDSISTTDHDGSPSRPSSPDISALSSSTSSLSSILEDRSGCASPGPIPRFALGSRLPPLGAPHSAFELSDLRTSLPSDENGSRRGGPSRTPVFRSPRSTPLPLSRPMSPAIQLSPRMRPLAQRLRTLAVTVDEDRVMDDRVVESPPAEESRTSTPSVKSEPETDSAPNSPRSKGFSETDPPQGDVQGSIVTDTQISSETRDEQMACTPTNTQPDPQLPMPWVDTEPSTPKNRHSPLTRSPSVASSPADEEDSKSGIVKQSESETEDEPQLSYAERRARKRAANAGPIDPTSVRTRGGAGFDWLGGGYAPMPMQPPPEVVHLAHQAERLGLKLQVESARPPTTQSELLMQMAQRQRRIEELQREQDAAATSYQLATWGITPPPIDPSFGGLPLPEFAPPPLPLSFSPQMPPLPMAPQNLSSSQQSYMSDSLTDLPPPLDYSSYAATPVYTDLPADPYAGMSPPGLTAASSATSASTPSDSSYMSSPPPPLLSAHLMPPTTRSSFKASPEMAPEDFMQGFMHQGGGSPPATGSGTHKCHSCGKTFRRPSGLKDHMNIHSGEKPYCCPLETCRKGFATRSNMIRHHNKTHPNRPKIGGVADIGTDMDEVPNVEIADPASEPGGSSSQGRFRVVQQSTKEVGVGPVRGAKERRTMRKQVGSGAQSMVG